ncbi:ClpP/crotonase [Microthyrium microscopicum]|uniref:ClpP/crotonase n=1 Tax=Microthyrium microscopicum TaxID=703497 RepID=A0A6A6UQ85_9PEZI|nr:ClpP/crotonase [Microthyrium microscopicum]
MADQLTNQPPSVTTYKLSYPAPHVLLITINRPKQMNSIPVLGHWEADSLFTWFDEEPSLRVAVITGAGDKAFSAGADLIEAGKTRGAGKAQAPVPLSGFMGVSRRVGKKPIIAAVNGFALGGGFEICLGCDMIVASPKAQFGLPEALRGLYAGAGGLSRLVRLVGLTQASEIALTGKRLSAEEAVARGVANKVSKTHESVVEEAIEMATLIGELSPDAVIVTKHGLRQALETASVERASQLTQERYGYALSQAPNFRIGLTAFAQKQKPNWVASKL